MPLLAPTKPHWFETLEAQIRDRAATATVAVFHPDITGRVRFEGGQCVQVHCADAKRDASDSLYALRGLGEGGYFEVRKMPMDRDEVVVCSEPKEKSGAACPGEERNALFDAVRERRFREAISIYTRFCAGCKARGSCDSVSLVEKNLGRLIVLTSPGGDDSLTD